MWIPARKERRIVENLRHLYTILQEYQDKKEKRILTVLKGPHAGEKAFFAGDGLLWERTGQGFFTEHREEAGAIRAEGQQELAGETVFCDCLGEAKKLVICGAGHVGVALLRMALLLGFDVTVLEDRPYFADGARRAGAKRVICDSFEQGLDAVDSDEDTYFVIMTRGHRYDLICLEKILGKSYAYLGMMGSRGRSALVKKKLLEQGFPAGQVEDLHAPIGLGIHAETPEEIAVSILGEIISVKNGDKKNSSFSEEQLELLGDGTDTRAKVLCTIVARRGSAPRSVGTKMLVLEDGTVSGTIGGGCVEAGVKEKARWLMQDKEKRQELISVSMTACDAEEEGMVCGGVIEVLLEKC